MCIRDSLKGMLEVLVQKIFGEGTTTRLRPSYFPFTEPSVEVDVSCFACGGCGCRLCKGTGWIEVLGAGIVNKKVLENCGIDSEEYSGLAFGIGIERLAMLKYGINNIKLLYQSDMRVLDQIDVYKRQVMIQKERTTDALFEEAVFKAKDVYKRQQFVLVTLLTAGASLWYTLILSLIHI